MTQTAVSARIKALEAALSVSLFERGPSGARLSAAGRQFQPHAEQMVRTWDYAAAGLSGGGADQLALRLGAQLSVWDRLLVDVAVWLEREQGKLPFTLNYDHGLNMAEAVEQRLLDMAIVSEVPRATRLGVCDLAPDRLILISTEQLSLVAGADLPLFINLEFGVDYDAHVQAVLPNRTQQHIVLGNALMGLRYLKQRGGMGYFPVSMVSQDLADGILYAVNGAPDLSLTCKVLYLLDNPALPQIQEVLRGMRLLRAEQG